MVQLPSMSFRLIEAERVQHPVSLLYAVLGVTRAGYYAWRERCPSLVSAKTRSSQALIRRIFSDSRESHGAARARRRLRPQVGKMRVLSASRPSTFTAELPFQPRELRSRGSREFAGHARAEARNGVAAWSE